MIATSREFSPARAKAGTTPFWARSPRPATAYPICFAIVLSLAVLFANQGASTGPSCGGVVEERASGTPADPDVIPACSGCPGGWPQYLGLAISSTCE